MMRRGNGASVMPFCHPFLVRIADQAGWSDCRKEITLKMEDPEQRLIRIGKTSSRTLMASGRTSRPSPAALSSLRCCWAMQPRWWISHRLSRHPICRWSELG